jgi:hypothetical protein
MFNTREEYLQAFISEVRPMFDLYSQPLPHNVRITCGFPLNAKRSKALSDVFPTNNSRDNHWEIFISPEVAVEKTVAELTIHELCRTTDGAFSRGVTFQKIANDMGLVPHPTKGYKRTSGSLQFLTMYGAIIDSLGKYPHAEVSYSQVKTQGTRMLSAKCPCVDAKGNHCYSIRLSSKWAKMGLPACPIDGTTLVLV